MTSPSHTGEGPTWDGINKAKEFLGIRTDVPGAYTEPDRIRFLRLAHLFASERANAVLKEEKMTKQQRLILSRLYTKWVEQADDAAYYGSAAGAVEDFKKLYKALRFKQDRTKEGK